MIKKSAIFLTAAATMLVGCTNADVDSLNNVEEGLTDVDNLANNELDELSAEATLATTEEVESQEWTALKEDPEVLISDSTGEAMFEGAIYGAVAALLLSSLYKSGGQDRSRVAYPSGVDRSKLAYQNGSYNLSKPSVLKGSTAKVIDINKKTDTSNNGGGGGKPTTSVGGSSTNNVDGANKTSNIAPVAPAVAPKGKGGISSGGKGGGAS